MDMTALAFLLLAVGHIDVVRAEPPGQVRVCPPRLVPGDRAFPALTVGCGNGGPPTCLATEVTGRKLVRKRGVEGAAFHWEVKGAPTRGRSGGPLVDRRGYLL